MARPLAACLALLVSISLAPAARLFAEDAAVPEAAPELESETSESDAIVVEPPSADDAADDGESESSDDTADIEPAGALGEVGPVLALIANGTGVSKPAGEASPGSVKDLIGDPATLNKVLGSFISPSSGWRFLRDIDFEFKVFDDNNEGTGLGFSYSYDRSLQDHDLSPDHPTVARGLDLSFRASGNVAFDGDKNPEDFLDTKLNLSFFQSAGGVVHEIDAASRQRLNQYVDRIIDIEDEEAFARSDTKREFLQLARSFLTDQYYFDLGLDAGFESDQAFSATQLVYGARAGVDVKGWNTDSPWAKFNLLDYPGAMIRLLTGYEDEFTPRGTSLPTAVAFMAYVDPVEEDPRAKVDDKDGFPRFSTEVSFKTPLARVLGDEVSFTANFRFWQEIGASSAVKSADLDDFEYFVATLVTDRGFFVSYSTGRLPFDKSDDQIYQLGFQYSLEGLL